MPWKSIRKLIASVNLRFYWCFAIRIQNWHGYSSDNLIHPALRMKNANMRVPPSYFRLPSFSAHKCDRVNGFLTAEVYVAPLHPELFAHLSMSRGTQRYTKVSSSRYEELRHRVEDQSSLRWEPNNDSEGDERIQAGVTERLHFG